MQTTIFATHKTVQNNDIGDIDCGCCFVYNQRYLYFLSSYNEIHQFKFYRFDMLENLKLAPLPKDIICRKYLCNIVRINDVQYIFGGRTSASHDLDTTQMSKFCFKTQTMSTDNYSGELPPSRCGATMVHCTSRNSLLVFGGFGGDYLGDMWEYKLDSGAWNQIEQVVPVAGRYSHAMVYHQATNCLYMLGGVISDTDSESNVYCFSLATRKWALYDSLPSYIEHGTSGYAFHTYMVTDDMVLVLGNESSMILEHH